MRRTSETDLSLRLMVAIVMLLFSSQHQEFAHRPCGDPSSLITTFSIHVRDGFLPEYDDSAGDVPCSSASLSTISIVVLENIYHHLEKGERAADGSVAWPKRKSVLRLSRSRWWDVVFSSFVTGERHRRSDHDSTSLCGPVRHSRAFFVFVSPLLPHCFPFRKAQRLTDRTLLGKFALAFERYYHSFSDF